MADDVRYRLLDEPLISVSDGAGRDTRLLSLPGLYAAMMRDAVGDFPALRPHQRHVWHAFLVQVAALAMHGAGLDELPMDAGAWRELLLALTPDDPDGAAWSLVTPPDRPALLQAPVPEATLSGFRKSIESPDTLDMLVTSRNHDLKSRIVHVARPEHWIYALVSLQTQEGFLGSGNYGISRMNGGFSSRPGFGVAPPGAAGARLRRDVKRLSAIRDRLLEDFPFYPAAGGVGLVWLLSWDGSRSLSMASLDPYYVEICRRVRLVDDGPGGEIRAVTAGTTAPRIDAKALAGCTGDPWTPLVSEGNGRKALTVDASWLSYKRLTPLLFPSPADPGAPRRSALQECGPEDPEKGLTIILRALVRGQGKTEGYHERRVPVSRTMRRFFGSAVPSDAASHMARERIEDAALLARKVLYPAVLTVFTGAPSANERKRDDDTAKRRAGAMLTRLDAAIDTTFFEDLDAELEHLDDVAARERVRASWLLRLRRKASVVLDQAIAEAPSAAMRHYRMQVRARRRFDSAFRRNFGERVASTEDGAPAGPDHS